jgi:hypothetical protein
VFMDVSDIHPGKDFRQAIDENVSKCAVLLAVIGPGWATMKDASGTRRLEQPNDFVRLEIASALARGIDVIPVLVHGTRMPNAADLPENLQGLAYRNAVELTHARWNSDVEVFSRSLREYVQRGDALATRSIRMAITGELPATRAAAPVAVEEPPAPAPQTSRLLRIAVGALILIGVAGIGAYVYMHQNLKQDKQQADSSQAAPEQAAAPVPSAAAAATAPAATPVAAPPSPAVKVAESAKLPVVQGLTGTWVNPAASKGKPMRLEIATKDGSASVHLWTRRHGAPFDLGIKSVPLSGDAISIQWTGPFSDSDAKHVDDQTVSMRIYRLGAGLHMIYADSENGSTGFDFVRSE